MTSLLKQWGNPHLLETRQMIHPSKGDDVGFQKCDFYCNCYGHISGILTHFREVSFITTRETEGGSWNLGEHKRFFLSKWGTEDFHKKAFKGFMIRLY